MRPRRLGSLLRPTVIACISLCPALAALVLMTSGARTRAVIAASSTEALSGGTTTVVDPSVNAYGHALANLDPARWAEVREGKALFAATWVELGQTDDARATLGPAARVREGLGPRFNERSCASCHFKDGRGRPPRERTGQPPLLLRLDIAGPDGQRLPDPVYGAQLQDGALPGLEAEGTISRSARTSRGRFADGEPFTLVAESITTTALTRGALHDGVRISARIPPSLVGLGLLEAVPDADILALADPEDRDGDGISGRPSWVDDGHGGRALGRFGWTAGQPNLLRQIATALREDMGVTSPLFPERPCAPTDAACAAGRHGPSPEIDAEDLERLAGYTRLLAPPARRGAHDPEVLQGKRHFMAIGCAGCHAPRLTTGTVPDLPELEMQSIRPYTDLLLHDMGEGLADEGSNGEPSGREWRTAPLWGMGLLATVNADARFLHDGRARDAEEAILWHGGEARAPRAAYVRLPRGARRALLRFLDSL